jgi:hypothetical protein
MAITKQKNNKNLNFLLIEYTGPNNIRADVLYIVV